MSLRGNTAPPDGCPRERSTAPAGCAAGSRMMNPRSGIGERPWMPPSSCWKSCNFSHEKTLPGRGWQIPAAPGQEAFLTPYLTTVRAGTRGNSGFKSVKKHSIPSGKCRKALQSTTKNSVQAFGTIRPGVRVSHLGPKRKARRKSCLSFWVPRPLAAPPFGDFNPRAGKARPPEILRFAPNLRRTRGAAQKGCWVVFCSQSQG